MADGIVNDRPDYEGIGDHIATSKNYGDLVHHSEFLDLLHMQKPSFGSSEDFDRFNFDYMQAISQISTHMLEAHRLALQNVRGEGYRIVPPEEQIEVSKRQARQEMSRAARKYANRLQFIRYEELSAEEQRRRDDESAKLTQLSQMMRRQLAKEP